MSRWYLVMFFLIFLWLSALTYLVYAPTFRVNPLAKTICEDALKRRQYLIEQSYLALGNSDRYGWLSQMVDGANQQAEAYCKPPS